MPWAHTAQGGPTRVILKVIFSSECVKVFVWVKQCQLFYCDEKSNKKKIKEKWVTIDEGCMICTVAPQHDRRLMLRKRGQRSRVFVSVCLCDWWLSMTALRREYGEKCRKKKSSGKMIQWKMRGLLWELLRNFLE